jgi:hypothetical protein
MSKSKRKAEQRIIKDRYTGTPLTEKEWIEAVKEAEETDIQDCQVDSRRIGTSSSGEI